jgi:hypothetical protein
MKPQPSSYLIDVLHSPTVAPDRRDKLALYEFLIGRWVTDVVTYEGNDVRHTGRGEIYAGWILQGRAIQDVWMIPPLNERTAEAPVLPVAGNWYGTTLRIYDPPIDAWRIYWLDPATQNFVRQIAHARGKDVVQEGAAENSSISQRWSFTEITPTSFHWLGEHSSNGGTSWDLVVEVFARRFS